MPKCFIICAGDLVNTGIEPADEDLVIACDAGIMYAKILGLNASVFIGDLDSIAPEDYESVKNDYPITLDFDTSLNTPLDLKENILIKLPERKDDTDTLAAIRYGLNKGYREFHLYAATGGVLDHTMANIQSLLFLKNHGAKGYIWDDGGMLTLIKNEDISFKDTMEGRLSIFAMEGTAKGVSIKGLSYEADDITIDEGFPIGVSNRFIGEKSTIAVKDGALLIVMYWE